MRALSLALALALGACTSSDPPAPECLAGDPSLPVELEILCMDAEHAVARLAQPMTQVPLVFPEQGGQILLLGVRARNLDSCALTMTASLRDPCTDELLAVEQRPVVLEPTADGWLEPRAGIRADWANLPVCPNVASTRDLQGQGYVLRIAIEDASGKTAETTLPVVPTCPDASAGGDGCLCQCQAGYSLGDECPGGLVPGTPEDCP
jgi:hypothetical protein